MFGEFSAFCFAHRRRILWAESIALIVLAILPWDLSLDGLLVWFFEIPESGTISFGILDFVAPAIALLQFFAPLGMMIWAARLERRGSKGASAPRIAVAAVGRHRRGVPRRRLALRRASVRRRRVVIPASAAIACMAVYWTVERLR